MIKLSIIFEIIAPRKFHTLYFADLKVRFLTIQNVPKLIKLQAVRGSLLHLFLREQKHDSPGVPRSQQDV